jgi:hypothetical protein
VDGAFGRMSARVGDYRTVAEQLFCHVGAFRGGIVAVDEFGPHGNFKRRAFHLFDMNRLGAPAATATPFSGRAKTCPSFFTST